MPCSKNNEKDDHHQDKHQKAILALIAGVGLAATGIYMESRRETAESKMITDIRKWSTAASGWKNRAVQNKEQFLGNILKTMLVKLLQNPFCPK